MANISLRQQAMEAEKEALREAGISLTKRRRRKVRKKKQPPDIYERSKHLFLPSHDRAKSAPAGDQGAARRRRAKSAPAQGRRKREAAKDTNEFITPEDLM